MCGFHFHAAAKSVERSAALVKRSDCLFRYFLAGVCRYPVVGSLCVKFWAIRPPDDISVSCRILLEFRLTMSHFEILGPSRSPMP